LCIASVFASFVGIKSGSNVWKYLVVGIFTIKLNSTHQAIQIFF
jgi:hypothetical protein